MFYVLFLMVLLVSKLIINLVTPRYSCNIAKAGVKHQSINQQFILQVPGFREWYNVKYSNDAAIYTYKLLQDYEAGDLMIKV